MPIKNHTLITLLSVLIGFSLACQNTVVEDVQIKLLAPEQDSIQLELITFDMLNYNEVPLNVIGENSETGMKFALKKPSFAKLKVNNSNHTLYLEPGDKLEIIIETDVSPPTISFRGQGAAANHYLSGASAIVNQFHQDQGAFWQGEIGAFSENVTELAEKLAGFHQGFRDTVSLSPALEDLLQSRNELIILDLVQQYLVITHQVLADRDSLPDFLRETTANVPLEAGFLDLHMFEYALVLDLYLRGGMQYFSIEGIATDKIDSVQATWPKRSQRLIESKEMSHELRTFLLAKNIDYWLGMQGLTPTIETLYQEYRQAYPSSRYRHSLEQYYLDWRKIAAGQPAPEIMGRNLDGDTLSLSDLRGKLVYVDAWASWCKPCRAEFPYYESLQAAFSDEEAIAFLFVSIDQERSEWEKLMQTKAIPEGIHINDLQENNEYDGITSAYKMWGIPQYLIIDKTGKIVSTKAPPPSSAKTKALLESLL
ncbi:MAG: TlpA disulfide reductase family protein [Bacteroidota bacterium]